MLSFILAYCAVLFVQRMRGGSVSGGLLRAQDFSVYVATSLQIIVTVCNPAGAIVHPIFRGFLRILITYATFDVRSVAIHPACLDGSLFVTETLSLLFLIVLTASALCCYRWLQQWKVMVRCMALLLMNLYSLACNIAAESLSCTYTPRGPVLRSNEHVSCFEGEHVPVEVLSFICIIIYLIGYPAYLFWRVKKAPNAQEVRAMWESYYREDAWWYRLVQMAFVFCSSIASHFLSSPRGLGAVIARVVIHVMGCAVVLYILLRYSPFNTESSWLRPVTVMSYATCLLGAILICAADASALSFVQQSTSLDVLSWMVMISCILLTIALVSSFLYEIWNGAKVEKVAESANDFINPVGVELSAATSSVREKIDHYGEETFDHNANDGSVFNNDSFQVYTHLHNIGWDVSQWHPVWVGDYQWVEVYNHETGEVGFVNVTMQTIQGVPPEGYPTEHYTEDHEQNLQWQ